MTAKPTTADIQVRELTSERIPAWDNYVMANEQTTFFHRAGWKQAIEQAFGHRCHFLYTESAGEITGILPLGHVKSRLFSNAIASTPFCVYGGIVANDDTSYAMLKNAACDLAKELKVDYLEFRNQSQQDSTWPTKELHVNFKKELLATPEENLTAIPRKQRAMVRKGIKANLKSSIIDDIDTFYKMYATSVRNLGTPVFSKRYFKILKEVFGDDCELLLITKDDNPICAVMNFYFKDQVLPYYGGGTTDARRVAGNDFMYWEVMRRACERGLKSFDFGRSKKGTGSFSFKKNWGFEPEPLHYEFFLVNAKSLPDINPLNPKYQLFIKLWKRLPLSISTLIGPLLAKNLG